MSASSVHSPSATTGAVRRELIARAALAVIARVGPDGLTHRAVAQEAGLPLSATTYWFASKEEMVRAAFEHSVERDLVYLAELRERARRWTPTTAVAGLTRMVEEICTTRREVAVVDSALWVEAIRRPALRPTAQAWLEALTAFYLDLLRQLQPAATEADARLLAAAIDGMIGHQLGAGGRFSRAATRAQLARLLAAVAG